MRHLYIVIETGSGTRGEIQAYLCPFDIGPRFAEVEAKRVLATVGARPCQVTGRRALAWENANLAHRPDGVRLSMTQRVKNLETRESIRAEASTMITESKARLRKR
jgi:hypothetical protein